MNSNDIDVGIEHRNLRSRLDRLRLMASAPDGVIGDEHVRWILEKEMRALREAVVAHFGHEEADGGYMSQIIQERPRFQNEIDELKVDHASLRTELDELAGPAFEGGEIADIRGDIIALLDRLEAHEHKENDLILRFVNVDTGCHGD